MYKKACHYYTLGGDDKAKSGRKTMLPPALKGYLFEILVIAPGAATSKTASAETAEASAVATSESSPIP